MRKWFTKIYRNEHETLLMNLSDQEYCENNMAASSCALNSILIHHDFITDKHTNKA